MDPSLPTAQSHSTTSGTFSEKYKGYTMVVSEHLLEFKEIFFFRQKELIDLDMMGTDNGKRWSSIGILHQFPNGRVAVQAKLSSSEQLCNIVHFPLCTVEKERKNFGGAIVVGALDAWQAEQRGLQNDDFLDLQPMADDLVTVWAQ
jgi:hypothetical protein